MVNYITVTSTSVIMGVIQDRYSHEEGLHLGGTAGLQVVQIFQGDVRKLVVKPSGLSCLRTTAVTLKLQKSSRGRYGLFLCGNADLHKTMSEARNLVLWTDDFWETTSLKGKKLRFRKGNTILGRILHQTYNFNHLGLVNAYLLNSFPNVSLLNFSAS